MLSHTLLLDRSSLPGLERLIRHAQTQQDDLPLPEEYALRCTACGHPVTDERLRIQVQGAHRHHCVNPVGLAFQVNCFSEAPGALALGHPQAEYSWFTGHRWRYALCGGCGEHLGWHYEGIERFFGLIEGSLKRD
ncbi:cereblon family protein [Endothiovibrio diazotrophicus]